MAGPVNPLPHSPMDDCKTTEVKSKKRPPSTEKCHALGSQIAATTEHRAAKKSRMPPTVLNMQALAAALVEMPEPYSPPHTFEEEGSSESNLIISNV